MNSRSLLTYLLLMLLTGVLEEGKGQVVPPFDKKEGVLLTTPLLNRVPIGGVGAGTFEVNSEGAITQGAWTHNSQRPIASLPGCFAAIWTKRGERISARSFTLKTPYSLPNIGALDFQGLFPEAFLTPKDPTLPLQVRLRVASPLIPHDLRNSSFPAGLFLFELKNPSTIPVEVSVLLSWENVLGVGGTARLGTTSNRTGTSVVSIPDEQGIFGMRMQGVPLTQGNSLEEHLRDNTTGEMALLMRPPRKEVSISMAGWNTLAPQPPWWEAFARDGTVSGSTGMGEEGKNHPAGAIAVRLTLSPGDYAEVPFAVAWHVPHHFALSGVDYGDYAAKAFPSAVRTAQELLTEYRHLIALTEEPQRRLLSSTLPRPLVSQILNSVAALTTHLTHGREGELGLLAEVGEAGENRAGANFASAYDALALNETLVNYFPALCRANLERLARTQSVDGSFPSDTGSLEQGYTRLQPSSSPTLPEPTSALLRNTCAYVLMVGQYGFGAEDEEALRFHSPFIQRAMGFLSQYLLSAEKSEQELLANALKMGLRLTRGLKPLEVDTLSAFTYLPTPKPLSTPLRTALAQAVGGYTPNALAGFDYDPQSQILRLTPEIPGTWRTLTIPVTKPRFWGRVEFKPRAKGYLVSFRVERLISLAHKAHFGGAGAVLVVQSVRVPKSAVESKEARILVSLGVAPIGIRSREAIGQEVVLTFQSPIKMATGDRLEIEWR